MIKGGFNTKDPTDRFEMDCVLSIAERRIDWIVDTKREGGTYVLGEV